MVVQHLFNYSVFLNFLLSWTFVVRRFWSYMLKRLISAWNKRLICKRFRTWLDSHIESIQIFNTCWVSMFIFLMFIIKFISYIIRCSIHILQWFSIIYCIHVFAFEISIIRFFSFEILFDWIWFLELASNTNSWVIIESENGFTVDAVCNSSYFLDWSFWLLSITF